MNTNLLADFLDATLEVKKFSADSSNNGLQVENSGTFTKVCCGVDASLEFFRAARKKGADFLICHHGLSWGDSLRRIAGLAKDRIKFLMDNNMALYASHLPLDAHEKYGNNIVIAQLLGLRALRQFGAYHGYMLGYAGMLPRELTLAQFERLVEAKIGQVQRTMDFGKKRIRSVGVISGGGTSAAEEAAQAGLDVFLSGEASLAGYNTARDMDLNVVFAGHYATERFGVQALGNLIRKKYNIPAEFVPLNVNY
jgi:dinuclear metal center YbgI/SA1388 family protein